ncbi:MAG TPA: discoidin domain-containing protein [Solirubrobacteraceae bacterium]
MLPGHATSRAALRQRAGTVTVRIGGPLATFRPDRAFGAALDGHESGDTRRIYTPSGVATMRASGLGAVSYRLRTELGGEVWHWTDHGSWSDRAHHSGYWTGSPVPGGPPPVATYGYRLPRRGNTIDQAENTGYSRIDDGTPATFWKSNPYLDRPFARSVHRPWVVVDLGRPRAIDALAVRWGTPWATRITVARWVGRAPAVRDGAPGENRSFAGRPSTLGRWVRFPAGARRAHAGSEVLRLGPRPLRARWIRVLVTRASRTAPPGSRDIRDRLGVAVRELGAGVLLADGRLRDVVRHGPSAGAQSVVWTSSTDPWHTARDRDPNTEQPGFGVVMASRLGAGRGLMTPVPAVYGVPSDAANLIRYLRAIGWPLGQVEVGEEPDGQNLLPEDDAELWRQAAVAVRAADPAAQLVGPGFSTALPDWTAWPDARGERSWTARWLAALHAGGGPQPSRFSFEWYPFDDPCASGASAIARGPALLRGLIARQRREGVRVPIAITEYGYSAFAAPAEVARTGAVFDVETALGLLAHGGRGAASYLYGLEPDALMREATRCDAWGNLVLWRTNDARRVLQPVAARWALDLLVRRWAQPGDLPHTLLRTSAAGPRAAGVTAFATRRPDGRLALLLANHTRRAIAVRLPAGLRTGVRAWAMDARTYRWHARGPRGRAAPDRAPLPIAVRGGRVTVRPVAITVLVGAAIAPAHTAATAAVTVSAGAPLARSFAAVDALGAGLDGHGHGDSAQIYRPATLRAMASSGLGAVSYRLRTELGIEAWHWTPDGRWSDPGHRRGYWTPTPRPGPLPLATYGYALPRRGTTHDQANDSGYSRLDDGTRATFWKSNPYLDARFSHAAHPQWALVDFGRHRAVDALRITWGAPFARRIHVQWWRGDNAVFLAGHPPGRWVDFPAGARSSAGGTQTLRVADRPIATRFVRILLERSSHSAPRGARDVRDRLGFAIRELGVGVLAPGGRFADLVRHRPDQHQTSTFVSSTDPWHRASDRDTSYEQPSFTTVARSGLLHGRPLMVPIPVLYGTPAAAVAELRWLRRQRIPVGRVELGEEPDGQLASPEDYGALYAQFARVLKRADPAVVLGGPGYQTAIPDWTFWPDARGRRSWTGRFVTQLRREHALRDLGFFSFEWYPWDDVCRPTAPQLRRSGPILDAVLARQARAGLPATVPRVITEYGYSAFTGAPEMGRAGALLNADIAARFIARDGGAAAYLYGYEPDVLSTDPAERCHSWGALTTQLRDARTGALHPTSIAWAARLLTGVWAAGPGPLHPAPVRLTVAPGGPPVRAYALTDHAGGTRVLVENLGRARAITVGLQAEGAAGGMRATVFDARTYVWHTAGANGYAAPNTGLRTQRVAPGGTVTIGPYGMAVLQAR